MARPRSGRRTSARQYVEQQLRAGLFGVTLQEAVLHWSALTDDLPQLPPHDEDDLVVDCDGRRRTRQTVSRDILRRRIIGMEHDLRDRSTCHIHSPTDGFHDSPLPSHVEPKCKEDPIRSSNSGVLDTNGEPNVTVDWTGFQKVACVRWYWKMKNELITRYIELCYPLHRDDLGMELDIEVARALPAFRHTSTLVALRAGRGAAMLSTFLWTVMENRLKNLARSARRRPRTVPLVLDGDRSAIRNEPAWEPDYPLSIHIRQAIRSVRDSNLLLAQAAGFSDAEVSTENLRMRRLRARRRLAAALAR